MKLGYARAGPEEALRGYAREDDAQAADPSGCDEEARPAFGHVEPTSELRHTD